MKKPHLFSIDAPDVTGDEALELMVYHLRMAAAYFEAVPDDPKVCLAELTRIMRQGEARTNPPALQAGTVWFDTITQAYEVMGKEG